MAVARLEFHRTGDDQLEVRLAGEWKIDSQRPRPEELERELDTRPAKRAKLVANDLEGWDSSLLVFVERAVAYGKRHSLEVDTSALPQSVRRLSALVEATSEPPDAPHQESPSFAARIGKSVLGSWKGTRQFIDFVGTASIALGRALRGQATFRRSDLWLHIQEAGAEALPIVTLISLLVGLILAFVGAIQLRRFGADIYVANLVGVAMVREMGAMMTGIILAGRTGAAYAAQLGTMKVTEEIDALTTFGIRPMEFLVLPRLLALSVMMPLLTLYADMLGIVGGAAVGVRLLHLSPELYLDQTLSSFTGTDAVLGIVKGAIYGVLVATAGCLRGLQCGTNAAAVGEAATRAVVTGIVAIIVADGLMAVLCNTLGI